jgi:solute:Na+ symporter, SSS family
MLLAGLMGYVALQFAIGVIVSRRIHNDTDYILAGRTLGPALVSFSVFATWFGAEAIVATTGEVYKNGLGGALVDPFGYAVAVIAAGLVLAGVLWRRGLTTFADLFEQRYCEATAKLVVIVLLPGSIFWAAAQIRAFGQVLSSSSGMSLWLAISLAAVLVGAYTTIGGLLADSVTDFLQGLVVIAGLLILTAVIAMQAGGVQAVFAATDPTRLGLMTALWESPLEKLEHIVIAICGSLVAVELISRYLGARSAAVARNGTIAGGVIYCMVGLMPVFIGLAATVLAARDPVLKAQLGDAEQVVATMARYYMPGLGYVIFAGAIVSAILSNVHSSLHAPASQVAHNIILKRLPGLDGKAKLNVVRATVLVLSVVAFVLALTSDRIKELVEIASAFGSAGVIVTTLFALFTRIGGPQSARAAILAGVSVWALGRFALDWQAPYIVALACSTVAYLGIAWYRGEMEAGAATR